jgi:holdfast attachment protein HfaA
MKKSRLLLVTGFALAASAAPALAQPVSTASQWERPYGVSPGQESQPFSAGSRDAAGNRVIANGVAQTGAGVSTRLNGGVGGQGGLGTLSAATAIGNVLNVNVQGRYNTVIVNSTQINNGDVTATAGAGGAQVTAQEPGQ